MRLWRVLPMAQTPLERWFNEQVGRLKAKAGATQLHVEFADGKLEEVAMDLLRQLFDPASASALGISTSPGARTAQQVTQYKIVAASW